MQNIINIAGSMRPVKRIAEPYKPSVNQHPPVGTMVKIPFNPLKLFLIITNIPC
jgi:hypothetical protein